jgi:ATP-dependent helicase/nuclease subunit A
VVDEGLREYQRWWTKRAETVAAGAVPSVAVRTVTEWTEQPQEELPWTAELPSASTPSAGPIQYGLFEEPPPPTASTSADTSGVTFIDLRVAAGAGGARFGELVHAVLASTPLGSPPGLYEAATEVQARIVGAPADERQAALEAVLRVGQHDLLRRAAAADARGEARRECPVTLTAPDGTLIEGVVDLAFKDEDGWVVIDFKTDREISQAGVERYSRQVALYAKAIANATGAAATPYLLRI